jgi:hypothetical protein
MTNSTPNTSLRIVIIYLLSSFFAGLLFSILALRSRKNGNSGIGWIFLSICCITFFGAISYSLFKTSSPNHDAFWYYLGIITLVANGMALLISFFTVFSKR